MKTIKILPVIIAFFIFGNVFNANAMDENSFKEKKSKSLLGFWKSKHINKYKYLAPVFPKEIPVEETITVFFKNILNPNSKINDNNTENIQEYKYLAPEFPQEIPVEEEISVYSTETNKMDYETPSNYKYLAPIFPTEIPEEEE